MCAEATDIRTCERLGQKYISKEYPGPSRHPKLRPFEVSIREGNIRQVKEFPLKLSKIK